jgi:integrase
LKEGKLAPVKGGVPTFEEFARGWWDYETCPYLTKQKARKKMSQSTASRGRYSVRVFLLPAFGKQKLDAISACRIDDWLTNAPKLGFANNTVNTAFRFLSIMLGEAARRGVTQVNPCRGVKTLPVQKKEIEILTPPEVKMLFSRGCSAIWQSEIVYMLNKLAACTGMRIGEVLGLRGEYIFEGYIRVCAQFNCYGYTDTKNHKGRDIPISRLIENDLRCLKSINGDGYLFSEDGGKKPVTRNRVSAEFYDALKKIGIDEKERVRRQITFHGWRHFFNTMLVASGISGSKVRSVTGHLSEEMTEYYTHFDTKKFAEVVDVQEQLLEAGAGIHEEKADDVA